MTDSTQDIDAGWDDLPTSPRASLAAFSAADDDDDDDIDAGWDDFLAADEAAVAAGTPRPRRKRAPRAQRDEKKRERAQERLLLGSERMREHEAAQKARAEAKRNKRANKAAAGAPAKTKAAKSSPAKGEAKRSGIAPSELAAPKQVAKPLPWIWAVGLLAFAVLVWWLAR